MRIGAAFEPTAAAYYRGVYPLEAMERRGHEIVWPHDDTGDPKLDELATCDVIYIFRRSEEALQRALQPLLAKGVGLVWDADDDLSAIPKNSPNYKTIGGRHGRRRFADTVRIARMAHVMTTTSATIRDKYATYGVDDIVIIENYLQKLKWRRGHRHRGVVIGWIGAMEHMEDVAQMRLREVLSEVLSAHRDVQVETVGVDLGLRERYTRHEAVHFNDLPRHMARYDIGLAPLADIPFNAARSNIKLKEYAASGVAWLASPRAPYRDLGEREGGLLVDDGDWAQAIGALVTDRRRRKSLSRNGKAWSVGQTIAASTDDWAEVFETARRRAGAALSAA